MNSEDESSEAKVGGGQVSPAPNKSPQSPTNKELRDMMEDDADQAPQTEVDTRALFGDSSSDSENDESENDHKKDEESKDDAKAESLDDLNGSRDAPGSPTGSLDKSTVPEKVFSPVASDQSETTKNQQDSDSVMASEEKREFLDDKFDKVDTRRLFGDDDDEDMDEDQEQPPEEQQEEEEEAPEEELIADIPELPALNPADLYLVSLPNFLHVNPKPFDPNTYEGEDDENEHDNENENDDNFNRIKLKVENTIRWRPRNGVAITADNIMNVEIESNARFVRWSDGSLSLVVGSEVFDVTLDEHSMEKQHHYLFLRNAGIFTAERHLTKSMKFRPASTNSLTHKKLTASVLTKHQKVQRTKMFTMLKNPEEMKQQAEKIEQEKIRARRKMEATRRRANARTGTSGLTEDGLMDEDYSSEDEYEYRAKRFPAQQARERIAGDGEFAEEEDDDFVVDDDEEIEVEESSEGEEGFSGSEGSDVDSEAEKRILDAKKGVVREDTKRPAEYGAGLEVDKRRRVVLSDDEDD